MAVVRSRFDPGSIPAARVIFLLSQSQNAPFKPEKLPVSTAYALTYCEVTLNSL
jgi:hypothetical protein